MANSTGIIGKVVALQGQAIVKSPDGKQHQLKVGDVVYEKDVILTMPGAHVELAFDSGHTYSIRQNETVSLDASVYAPAQVDVANAALLPPDTSAQNVSNAVVGGNSLDQLLEETAAGLGGGDAGDGNSFVRLDRIAENVTPGSNDAVPLVAASPPTENAPASPPSDAVQVIAVSSPSAPEGGVQNFVVQLSGPSAQAIQLNLALSSGSATVGVDTTSQLVSFDGGQTFVSFSNGVVTVPAGVTSVLVRVVVPNDGLIEGTESLSLGASTAANVVVVTGAGTIVDSVPPTISIAGPIEVNETSGLATLTVSLSVASTLSVSVNYATANGSALAGSDFTAVVGSIVFAPGETSKTITVPITSDRIFEGAENFSVNLSNPNNAVIGTSSSNVTIRDGALVVESISSPTVAEGGALIFDVTLNGTSNTSTSVSLNFASGSATLGVDTGNQEFSIDGGASWNPLGGAVIVPPGANSFQVRIATLTDNLIEGSETLTLSAGTTQNVSPMVGTGTITEGTLTTVSISGPSDVNEGAGIISYTISLSNASQSPVTVSYGTNNGSALAGSDYLTSTGSVTFAPGETTKTITVAILNDSIFEGAENYSVNLSNVSNATIGTGSVTTTIHDDGTGVGGNDDDRIVVSSVSSPTAVEGNNLVFNVSLSGASSVDMSVSVNASSGSAILGVDTSGQEFSLDDGATWSPLGGTVIVPAGATSFQVRIPALVDGLLEGNETLSLAAATAQNASPVTGVGTITDGAIVTINLSGPVSVNESAGTVSYTISLSSANSAPVSVNYSTNNGTALAGSDYASATGSITFAPGETSKVITVSITDDLLAENSETFQVNLSGAINATIGTASVTTTIVDNDLPSVSASQVTVNESDLASGTNPTGTGESASGTMTITASNGVQSINVNGTVLTLAQLNALSGSPQAINTGEGTITLTNYVAGTGVLSYTYSITAAQNVAGANVLDSFTITVTDGASVTSSATTFGATIVDDAPTAGNDSFSTAINTVATGSVAGNDKVGADGGVWALGTAPLHGTVTINASTGAYSFTPTSGYAGTDSFTYTITDGDGDVATATVAVTIGSGTPPNVVIVDNNGAVGGQVTVNESDLASGTNPTGTGESASGTMTITASNGVQSINVNGTVLTLAQLNALSGSPQAINTGEGTITLTNYVAGTGVLSYTYSITAAQNVAGANVLDSFTITVTDGASVTSSATTFGATIVDDAPTAGNDSFSTAINTVATGSVAGNDKVGADGGVWALGTAPLHGTVTINASTGAYSFTPTSGYAGTDSFTYTITDGDGDVATATVAVTIGSGTPPNVVIVDNNGAVGGQVTVNESDLASGTNPTGTGESASGTMTITASNGVQSINVNGTVLTLAQLNALSGSPQAINTGEGTITLTNYVAGTGVLSYTYSITAAQNVAGANVLDSFTITVTDGASVTSSATTFGATIVDDAPTAGNDSFSTAINTVATGSVAGNDKVGADGGVWALGTAPLHGTVTINASTGAYSFTPTSGYAGTDSFTYTITDGDGDVATATVAVTIGSGTPPNVVIVDNNGAVGGQVTVNESDLASGTNPTGTGESASGTMTITASNGVQSINVNGTVLTLAQLNALSGSPQAINTGEGTITLTNYVAGTGVLSYTYSITAAQNVAGANVLDSFTITVTDGASVTSSATTFGATIVDDAPTAGNDSFSTAINTVATGSVAGNDKVGADGGVWALGTAPLHGTVTINASTGAYSFTPTSGYAGTDSFTYTITDGDGDVATATVAVTIGSGTPPNVVIVDNNGAVGGQVTVNESDLASGTNPTGTGESASGTMTITASNGVQSINVNGTVLTLAQLNALSGSPQAINTGEGTITLTNYVAGTGVLSYTYSITAAQNVAGANVLDSFTITVTDGASVTSSATTFGATIVDDAPTAGNDSFSTAINTVATGSVAGNDKVGADGGVWALGTAPLHGTVTINASTGAYSFTPTSGYAGTDSFTYTITDGDGDVATATVAVTIGSGTPPNVVIVDNNGAVGGQVTVNESDLASGTNPTGTGESASGTMTITASNGVQSINVNGTVLTLAQLNALSGSPQAINTGEGTITLTNYVAGTGVLSYTYSITAAQNVAGANVLDSFTITVTDGASVTSSATTFGATIVDDAPTAGNDSFSTAINTVATGSVAGNDKVGADGGVWALGTAPLHGTVTINASTGAYSFTPTSGYAGTDSFTYTITDGDGDVATATVAVTIGSGTPPNVVIVDNNGAVGGQVTVNESDLASGTNPTGTGESASGTMTITASNGVQSINVNGTVLTLAQLNALSGSPQAINTGEGTITLTNYVAGTGVLSYTYSITAAQNVAGANVLDSFTITVTDGASVTSSATTFGATIVDDAPTAGNDSFSTAINTVATGSVAGNDKVGADGGVWALGTAPLHGTVTINASTGAYSFTPTSGYAGTDSFTYTITDGDGDVATATVAVTIGSGTPPNVVIVDNNGAVGGQVTVNESDLASGTNPTGTGESASGTMTITASNGVQSINVNGTVLTLAQLNALSGSPQAINTGEGTITLTNYVAGTGVLSYTYSITAAQNVAGANVLDSFTITVTDGASVTSSATTFGATIVDDAPTAGNDSFSTAINTVATGSVAGNDKVGADGGVWALGTAPLHGTVTINASTGAYSFTPTSGYAGTDSFTYTITDGDGDVATATVAVTIGSGTPPNVVIVDNNGAVGGQVTVNESDLASGTNPTGTGESASGTMTITASNGVQSINVNGTVLTLAQLNALSGSPQAINTGEGTITLTNYVAGTGVLSYTYSITAAQNVAGANVLDSFTITVTDGASVTSSATTFGATIVDDAPTAGNDSFSTAINTVATGSVAGNDKVGADGGVWALGTAPLHGTVTINASTGAYSFTPTSGYAGTDSFTYTITDGDGDVATATVAVTIGSGTPPNVVIVDNNGAVGGQVTVNESDLASGTNPTGTGESASGTMTITASNGVQSINVNGTVLTLAQLNALSGSPQAINTGEGTITLTNYVAGTGVLSYTYSITAAQNVAGANVLDSFTITVTDGASVTSSATTFGATIVDDAPTAGNDSFSTAINTVATGSVAGNDKVGADGGVWALGTAPLHGTVTINASTGAYSFTPTSGYAGTDSFTYTITDGDGDVATATVAVTIGSGTPPNVVIVDNNGAVGGQVTVNESDLASGTNPTGTGESASGTMTITASNGVQSINVNGTVLTLAQLNALSGSPQAINTGEGTITLTNYVAGTGVLSYTYSITAAQNVAGANVLDSFTITVTDGASVTSSATTFGATIVDDAPTAGNDSFSTAINTVATGSVAGNDKVGADGGVWALGTAPLHGTVTINASTGAYSFTPTSGYAGTDSFTYTITDGDGDVATATVAVTIGSGTPPNVVIVDNNGAVGGQVTVNESDLASGTNPTGTGESASGTMTITASNGVQSINVNGTVLTLAQLNALSGSPQAINTGEGTITLTNYVAGTGVLSYTYSITAAQNVAGANVLDSFTITVTDGASVTSSATTFGATIVDDAPTAGNDSFSTAINTVATGSVAGNDKVGADGGVWALGTAPLHGTVTINASTGAYSFTPTSGYAGTDSFTYTITDGDGDVATATVAVTIGSGTPPNVVIVDNNGAVGGQVTVNESDLASGTNPTGTGESASGTMTITASNGVQSINVNGTVLTLAQLNALSGSPQAINTGEGTITLTNYVAGTGVLSYTYSITAAQNVAGANVLDSFTITVTDGASVTSSATTFGATIVDDAPTAGNDSFSTAINTVATGSVAGNDKVGADGGVWALGTAPLHGTVTINASTGAYSFTPTSGYAGTDSFTYTITDGDGDVATATVAVTIGSGTPPNVVIVDNNGAVGGQVTVNESDLASGTNPTGTGESASGTMTITASNGVQSINVNGTVLTLAQLNALSGSPQAINTGEGTITLTNYVAGTGVLSYTYSITAAQNVAGANVLDSFTITVTDGASVTSSATTFGATIVDDAPTAGNDSFSTAINTVATGSVAGNDKVGADGGVWALGTAPLHGTVTINASTGAYSFTPTSGYAGTDSFTYTITDGDGDVATATVAVTIGSGTPPNVVIVDNNGAVGGQVTVNESDLASGTNPTGTGESASGTMTITASNGVQSINVNGTVLTLAQLNALSGSPQAINTGEGTITLTNYVAGTGVLSYTYSITAAQNVAGANVLDSFTITVTDGASVTSSATTFGATIVDDAPTAGNDSFSTAINTVATGSVAGNDKVGADGGVWALGTAPLHGTVTINASTGAYSFTPTSGYAGTDSFTYTITDGDGDVATATVAVTIGSGTPPNVVIVDNNGAVGGQVTVNESDLASGTNPTGTGESASGTMTITASNGVQSINVNGTVLTLAQLNALSGSPQAINTGEGTITLTNYVAGTGVLSYTYSITAAQNVAGANVLDSFTITVTDGASVTSSATTFGATIVDDAPTAGNDSFSTAINTVATGSVAGNDKVGADGGVWALGTAPLHGTVTINASTGAYSFTPTSGYAGTDSFTYTITDGDGDVATATVAVTIGSGTPPNVVIVDNNGAVGGQVTVNESDLASGTNPTGTGESASGTMTITASNGVQSINVNGTVLTLAQLNALSGSPQAINTGEGTITLTNYVAGTGVLSYTYSITAAQNVAGANVLDSFTITVTDGASVTSSATTFGATIVDDAPTAGNDSFSTAINTVATGSVAGNDKVGADGGVWALGTAPLHGTVTINASTGAYSFTPTSGYAGTDSFTYTITDGDGDVATATVAVTIGSGTPPNVVIVDNNGAVGGQVTVNESDLASGTNPTGTGESASGTMTITASNGVQSINVNGTVLTLAQLNALSGSPQAINTGEGTITLTNYVAGTGVLSYTYSITAAQNVAGANVLDSFTITVTDGASVTSSATTFGATIVDDAPTAGNDSFSTAINTVATGSVAGNDKVGADGGVWALGTAPLHGTVTINASTGAYSFTPTSGYAGTDSFTYTITDGDGDVATATVAVTIGSGTPPNVVIVDNNGAVGGQVTVNESDLASGTNPTGTGESASGTMTITASNGVQSINVNGTVLTLAQLNALSGSPQAINTGEGTITLTNYVAGTGVLSYTYSITAAQNVAGANVLDSFTITVTDGASVTSSATTFGATIVDDAPTAGNDSFSTAINTVATGSVAGNDKVGADGGVWALGTAPLHGTVTINASTGAYSFTPTSGYAGTDSFTYTITDGDGDVATATVAVTIGSGTPPNVVIVDNNGAVGGQVTVNESDLASGTNPTGTGESASGTMTITASNGVQSINVNGTVLTLAQLNALSGSPQAINTGEGTITLTNYVAGTGVLSYTYSITAAQNVAGANVLDSFTITVTDGASVTSSATTFGATIVDDAPTAGNDSFSTAINTVATGSVAGNDKVGADGGVWALGTAPLHGTVTINASTGAYSFTPTSGYAGTDSFTYTITDGDGDVATATVAVTIGSGTPPNVVIVDNNGAVGGQVTVNESDLASGTNPTGTGESASGTMTITASNGVQSINVNGTVLTLAQLNALSGSPQAINTGEGTITLTNYVAGTGVLSYTYSITAAQNVAGANVLDSFTITVTDGASVTSSATTFGATIVDDAPTAGNDSFSTAINTVATGSVAGNDKVGADGGVWALGTAPLHGTVTINASTGAYSFTPTSGYAGTDSFTYTITDGDGDVATATVAVTIGSGTPPNVVIVDNNGAVGGQVTVNESDLASGTNPTGTGESASGTMTITASNGVQSINVNGTVLTLAQLNALSGSPQAINTGEGTITLTNYVAGTGVLSYTYSITAAQNVAGANVLDSFTITVTDGASVTSSATTFGATIVDDAPTAGNDSGTTALNTVFTGNVSTNDTKGADATGATFVVATNPTNGTVVITAATGAYTYTPNAGYVGTDSFTYTLTDGDGDTSTATVNMNVVNTPPVSTSSTITITEDAAGVVTGGGSVVAASYRFSWSDFGISDVNGGTLSVRPTTAPVEGLLQFFNGATWVSAVGLTITQAQVAAGNLRFVPDLNESGDPSFPTAGIGNLRTSYASFNFQGVDSGGSTSTPSTLTVNVRPVADLPTLTVTNVASSTLFSTSWETADTGLAQTVLNVDNTSTSYTATTTLSGWTRVDTPDPLAGGNNAFELWSSGDNITGQNGVATAMNAMAGNGTNWLELNNASGNVQTLGIERSVTTVAGNVYNLSFDYAARNGYVSDFTVMTILVDGVSVASYSNLSPNNSLNWRTINFNFVGTGASQTIRIITDAKQYDANGRGAMIDDIVLTRHQGAIAGNANSGANTRISLSSSVSATLVDTDTSESLSYNFSSLPAGSIIITAANPGGITPVGGIVTVPASQLATAQLQLPSATLGSISLNVTATATEPGAGASSVTTASQALNFTVLNSGTGGTKYVVSSGDTPVLIGGTGNNGTITGFNQITNFNTAQHKLDLNVTPFSAANTAGTNGADSTLTIGGTTVRSHAISNGMITFDDANTFATALTLTSTENVAAVVQYLRANDLGNAGVTVAFTASIGGTAHTYIYQQVGNTANATNDILIDLVNVTLTSGGTSLTSLISSSIIDPLIIDLGTKGIALSQLGDGVQFDINADGKLDQIAWTQGEDGILAYDFNGDGVINNGSEIFSPYFGGGNYASSIAALTTLDSNGDGVIDAKDAAYGKLLVWQDINHNGVSDTGELIGLAVHGITSISLGAHQYISEINDLTNGQTILSQGSYIKIDGSHGQFVEVNFDAALGRSSQTVDAQETINAGQEHLLIGSADANVFKWSLDDGGVAGDPTVDMLMNFDNSSANEGGDILDLRDLLVGETHTGNLVGNLSNYMHFEFVGGNTVVHVSTEGGFASGYTAQHENQTMIMQGVNLMSGFATDQAIIQDLLSKGKLIVD